MAFASGGRRSIQLSYGREGSNVRPRIWAGQGLEKVTAPGRNHRLGRRVSARNKPSSVPTEMGEDHFSGTVVTDDLERPTRDSDGAGHPSSLFGLAPSGVCHATSVTGRPVRSYRTVSPLPVPRREAGPSAVCSLLHFPSPHGARALPGTLPFGARTFLRQGVRQSRLPAAILTRVLVLGYPSGEGQVPDASVDCTVDAPASSRPNSHDGYARLGADDRGGGADLFRRYRRSLQQTPDSTADGLQQLGVALPGSKACLHRGRPRAVTHPRNGIDATAEAHVP